MNKAKDVLAYLEFLNKKTIDVSNHMIDVYQNKKENLTMTYNQAMDFVNLHVASENLEKAIELLEQSLSTLDYIGKNLEIELTERDVEL